MAVDGSLQTIQHTDIQQNPYWVVDLGQMYSITSVEVYNEPNGNGKTLISIFVSRGKVLCGNQKLEVAYNRKHIATNQLQTYS